MWGGFDGVAVADGLDWHTVPPPLSRSATLIWAVFVLTARSFFHLLVSRSCMWLMKDVFFRV